MNFKIYPVLLSGGAGSRLWPLSRNSKPKQFTNLAGDKNLFETTLNRCQNDIFHEPIVVCAEHHLDLAKKGFLNQKINSGTIILEPAPRNTAPAVLVSALYLYAKDKEAVMMVMPSDHLIENHKVFIEAAKIAAVSASKGYLTTFGIKPEYPETGFGYIKKGEAEGSFFVVDCFVEKPDLKTAEKYLQSGEYFWNSGMFMFKAETLIEEFEKFEPEMVNSCQISLEKAKTKGSEILLEKVSFALSKSISFDYAVMEKTDKAAVVEVNNSGWSDIGSYKALWEIADKDNNGNVKTEKMLLIEAKNCLIKSETKQLVSVVGIDDLVVVVKDDAILIVPKDKSQDVKKIVDCLKENNEKSYL